MAIPVVAIPAIVEAGIKIIDKLFPDKEQADKAKLALFEMQQRGELAHLDAEVKLGESQAQINAVEAASDSKFKSWWRPALGWVCVFGLAYQFLIRPLVILALVIANVQADFSVFDLDVATLATILFGMLGLGYYRTVEKKYGVA